MDDILTAIYKTDPTVSLFDLKLSRSELEEVATFFNEFDFNPVISKSPPAAVWSQFWFREALDKAGEQSERCLFPAFTAMLLSVQNIKMIPDLACEMIRDALLLMTQAIQEARRARMQGRSGFSATRKMEADTTGGLLTRRQQDILEDVRMEQKQIQKATEVINYKRTDNVGISSFRTTQAKGSSRRLFFEVGPGRFEVNPLIETPKESQWKLGTGEFQGVPREERNI
ncbi:uncharacterized protein MONOS_12115 [Monocercomonoides exilis]|uniref:uncharacterized protein n=1 Tax=Monocercomonoides exilis TaxID=2049356 RepID=UPI0035593BCE|nr:hypothetical protein MONOS_12115 [Monocercomonoides exilis]|eukprot:MONOS_12115.1-p1 / transcript=MONOS_12115.1 / gene=MONOS_12115 / organism=Monocercomonoides_exilis_PA203 / gene_product=unspecified product / transcript_product=unspecified product / location=Mono_scaffold00647:13019-13702(-) / protein_length=228 / sequence_SO=supercontig / SO=protein_coding / is_pseudo=false